MHLTAAQDGSADILVCLQQRGFAYTADLKTKLLNVAGAYNKLVQSGLYSCNTINRGHMTR
jgi:hypothetical protein